MRSRIVNLDLDRFYVYIILSLLLHLILIYFFPFGSLTGVASSEGSNMQNFGMVEYVEIQAVERKIKSSSGSASENVKPKPESQKQENKKEVKEENKSDKPQEQPQQTQKAVEKQEAKSPQKETESTPQKNNEEVLSTQNPDSEVEIDKTKTEEKSQQQQKPSEEAEVENKTQPEASSEVEPAPEPPPTAGELIGLSPKPVYPKYLVGEQASGTVKVRANINKNGEIKNVEVVKSANNEKMDRNAVATVKRGWKFKSYQKPYKLDITIKYFIDEQGNSRVDVNLGELIFD